MALTGSRRAARERALGMCYELEVRELTVDELLAQQPAEPDAYAVSLVRGVEDHAPTSTSSCASSPSTGRWSGCRRSTARCCGSAPSSSGWEPDMPTGVVISEAVELAKQYSTKDSGRFVNGLLSRIAEELRPQPGV